MINYNLNNIFQSPTHLHLLCWNLFDIQLHKKGLLFIKQLIEDEDIKDIVLPMIRPLGRKDFSFYDGSVLEYGNPGTENIDYDIIEGNNFSYLELWLQTSEELKELVWDKIRKWIDENQHGFARKSLQNEIWRPFSSDLNENGNYYPRHKTELPSNFPKVLSSIITESKIPIFLKYVWARSTEVIISKVILNGQIRLLDPIRERALFSNLLHEVVSEFDLMSTGLIGHFQNIDPKHFGISHMPAFAVNAITSPRPNYQVERVLGQISTHPYRW